VTDTIKHMHKLSSALQTPGGITGIAVEVLPDFDAVLDFYTPWAESAGADSVEDFLLAKNLIHPAKPTREDQPFYLLYVATRAAYPFVVGEVDARILVPGNGVRPPIKWEIPVEADKLALELKAEALTGAALESDPGPA
jgi:hypothetical protein